MFGWSLPAGCSTLPGEEQEEPIALACTTCGRFIKQNVVRTYPVEVEIILENDARGILWADTICCYWCDNCKIEIENPRTVYA